MTRGALTRRGAMAVLGGGLAAAAAPGARKVHAAARLSYDIAPKPIASGLWMVEGLTEYFSTENGGAIVNCVLMDTDDGLAIIDTGSSLRYGEALRAAALQTTGRGVAEVINTHHHPDHFFGNQAFADLPLRALDRTAELAARDADGFSDNMYRLLGDWMRGTDPVPPTSALAPGDFAIGGRKLRAYPLSGHTESDLAILDLETGTLIAGDLAFLDRAPTTPNANLPAWRESLDALARIDAAAIVPGHGPLDATGRSLVQTRAYIDWLDATLNAAAREGLDMVEIMALPLPPEFAAMGAQPQEFHRSVAHLYPDVEAAVLPLAN